MPPPELLQQYEDVIPGSADRILRMAESNTTERANLDNKLVEGEIRTADMSQGAALFLVLLAFAGAATFFALGNNVAGCAFVSLPVLGMIRTVVSKARGEDD